MIFVNSWEPRNVSLSHHLNVSLFACMSQCQEDPTKLQSCQPRPTFDTLSRKLGKMPNILWLRSFMAPKWPINGPSDQARCPQLAKIWCMVSNFIHSCSAVVILGLKLVYFPPKAAKSSQVAKFGQNGHTWPINGPQWAKTCSPSLFFQA